MVSLKKKCSGLGLDDFSGQRFEGADVSVILKILDECEHNIRIFLRDLDRKKITLEHKAVFRILFWSRDRCKILFKSLVNDQGEFLNDETIYCARVSLFCDEINMSTTWNNWDGVWSLLDLEATDWSQIRGLITPIGWDNIETDEVTIPVWDRMIWVRAISVPLELVWVVDGAKDWFHQKVILLVWKDVTTAIMQIDKLVASLVQREQDLEKFHQSQFLRAMAHEHKNLANQLSQTITMLEDYGDDLTDQEKDDLLSGAAKSWRKLLYMLDQILEFVRLDSWQKDIELSEFSLWNLIIWECSSFTSKAKEKKKIKFSYPAIEWIRILCDANVIKKVVENLVGNAIKFTKKWEVRLEYYIEWEKLRIIVCDTWPWIKKSVQTSLYEPLKMGDSSSTRWTEWTWMWLAVLSRMLDRINGTLEVTTNVWKWTMFIATLPIKLLTEINHDLDIFLSDWFNVSDYLCWMDKKSTKKQDKKRFVLNIVEPEPEPEPEPKMKPLNISIISSSQMNRLQFRAVSSGQRCNPVVYNDIPDELNEDTDILVVEWLCLKDFESLLEKCKWKNIILIISNRWSRWYTTLAYGKWFQAYEMWPLEDLKKLLIKLRSEN